MLTQHMSYVADHSGMSNAYGSYKPAVQVGMQPPAYHMGKGMPTGNVHTFDAASHGSLQRVRSAEWSRVPKKVGAEDKGPSEDYTFFGVDLKPVLPVALAVSTVIGGLCMLLVQIPMLSRFTSLSQVWLSAPFAVLHTIVLGCMAYCAFADPGQVKKRRNMNIGAVGCMDIEEGMPRRAHKSWQYSRPICRYDHYCKYGCKMSSVFSITVNL